MAVDTPARIAILGAGPMGLETALYARFLGYEVEIYERGAVCENLLRWGHVRLFSPFSSNRTPLGVAALKAQAPDFPFPADDALLTGRELAEQYFLPLAQSDLLIDGLHLGVEVLAVGREGLWKGDLVKEKARGKTPFRILIRNAAGKEEIRTAKIVIDTTGAFGNPNWLGQGGIPALGERAAAPAIEYELPNILGAAREQYAGRHVLVVGAGHSAATCVVALAELAAQVPDTRVTWITRRAAEEGEAPLRIIPNDRLPERQRLAQTANELASQTGPVTHLPGTTIHAIESNGEGFVLELRGEHAGPLAVDRVIANVGYRPDHRLSQELQVHLCYATEGPMKLAATLLENPSPDCLDQKSVGVDALRTPERNFYILGAKSFGRRSEFLLSIGHEQIRELFTLIGGRADLNLYDSIKRLKS